MTYEWNRLKRIGTSQTLLTRLFLLALLGSDAVFAKTPLDIIDDDWLEVKSPNFHIITDMKADLAQHFTRDLEQFRYYLIEYIDIQMKKDIPPLKIYAFQRNSTYRAFKLPKNSAGVFFHHSSGNYAISAMRGYVTDTRKQNFAQQVLRHEYIHFVFEHSHFQGDYPRWYEEGMAELLSTIRLHKNTLHFGEINLPRLQYMNFSKKVDIEALLKADRIPESRRQGSDFYAHALALVHYCYANPEIQHQLQNYVKLASKGVGVDEAFTQSFEMDYEALGSEIRKYLLRQKFPFYKIEITDPFQPEFLTINRLSKNQLAFHLGDLARIVGFREEADKKVVINLLDQAIKAQVPEFHTAYLHKFHTLLHSGDSDKALETFKIMLQQLPDYPGTYDAQADLLVHEMDKLLAANDPQWTDLFKLARGKYRKAIHMDKGFLPAFIGLAQLYSKHPGEDIDLSEGLTAYGETTYFINYPYFEYDYAVLLLRSKKLKQARDLLNNVIARAKDEELVNKARELKLGIIIKE